MFNYTKAELIVMPISLAVIIAITFALYFLLRNKSEKVRSIPFLVITILLLIGEVAKQIVNLTAEGGYDYWAIPLHFCSTYFIWFTLAEFTKGKFRKHMQTIAFVMSLYLFPALYSSPRSIINDACEHIFLTFADAHTFFFHQLVVLYMMLAIAFKRFQPVKSDCWIFAVCMATYFVIACVFAHGLDTNYFNILRSEIAFMENFRLKVGQVVYTIVFGLAMTSLGALLIALSLWIKKHWFESESEVEAAIEEDAEMCVPAK